MHIDNVPEREMADETGGVKGLLGTKRPTSYDDTFYIREGVGGIMVVNDS